jgi:hypothetical protein
MNETERANVLAEILRQVMVVPGPALCGTIFEATMKALKLPEEECSLEITMGIFLLVRSGLLQSNGYDPVAQSMLMSNSNTTTLRASTEALRYLWGEQVCDPDPEDLGD